MKRIPCIFILAAVIVMTMISCSDDDYKTYSTYITASGLVVPYEGGTFSVAYNITNQKDGANLLASTEADWITDIDLSLTDTLSFFVEYNYERDSRSTEIEFLYILDADTLTTRTVRVTQEYYSQYVFNASYACGRCYGMTNNYNNDNIRQYSIYFSDVPMEEYGVFEEGATYYFLDLWTNADADGIEFVSLPAGQYSFGQVGENWAISGDSKYFVMNTRENEDDDLYFEEAEIVGGTFNVSQIQVGLGGGIVSRLEDVWGGVHDLTFSGELSLENLGLISTLEEDETFELSSDVPCEARYYGDYYQTGIANWMLCIEPEAGAGFIIDICADASFDMDGGVPEGTFSISSTGGVLGTFLAGSIFNGYLSGTWLVSFDEEGALTAPYAPIYDGIVEISASGDSYTVTIDGYDDRLNNIVGSWIGTPTLTDYRTSTTSLKRSGIQLLN